MKKPVKYSLIIILILLLLGIILYPKIKPLLKQNKSQNAPIGTGTPGKGGQSGRTGMGQQTLLASGYVIVPTEMSYLMETTGSVIPDEEVELSFETSGKVVGIYFLEGTHVKKGDLLAKINDKPLQAQLLKLQAQKKLTEEREFRQRQLLDRDAISRESYDQVATEIQTLQADIQLIHARISETELRAPFDGIVGIRLISEGAYANTQTKLVRLVKISPLKIEFSVNEKYIDEFRPGFPLTFKIEENPEEYSAKIYAVEPKADMTTRTFVARALYPNLKEELRPGRSATIKVLLSQIKDAVSIPTEAIIPEMEGEKVFILKNGKAHQVGISTGLRTESRIQITSGLNFGDTLLTTAILQLRESLPVKLDTLISNKSVTLINQ